ncbi:MAG: succinylglutamate desuccinylase/aspartoacylase family protein [Burkholderiales bacterium]|nr:MAG: succinylglutamate desuccinylase/aspartoacylase family protein [Burkholderiales bacterium]
MEEISIGTALSREPGTVRGRLKVADFPDGTPMEIPVVIVRGSRPGKTLWLHGCVHGNEYCGTFIIHELLRALAPDEMAGSVVALPVLNVSAFHKNQRMSPFELYGGGDLNRCFPGQQDGSLTQQIAFHVYRHLKQYADCLVDFHTAMTPDVRWALYAAFPGEVGAAGEAIARAFGFHSTLAAAPDILGGSAMMAAAKDGIPGFIVEAGGKGPAFARATVVDAAERLRNVMRHLGILSGEVRSYGKIANFARFAWVTAPRGGLFQPSVRCGDTLDEGTVLGHYFDVYGAPTGEALSPHAGTVLAIHPGPLMGNGETLVHIGLEARES